MPKLIKMNFEESLKKVDALKLQSANPVLAELLKTVEKDGIKSAAGEHTKFGLDFSKSGAISRRGGRPIG